MTVEMWLYIRLLHRAEIPHNKYVMCMCMCMCQSVWCFPCVWMDSFCGLAILTILSLSIFHCFSFGLEKITPCHTWTINCCWIDAISLFVQCCL